MSTLITNFPKKSSENDESYKVIQVKLDGHCYLWFSEIDLTNLNISMILKVGCGHAGTLAQLLEREGRRFGLYDDRKPFRVTEWRYATDAELMEPCLLYYTVHDKLVQKLVPALIGEGYQVLGMGAAKINIEERIATFHDYSKSYGVGLDEEQLRLLLLLKPDWKVMCYDRKITNETE